MAATPGTTLTTRDEAARPPKPTVACWPLSSVSKVHSGRSPPGAEITTRNSVPGRNVWAIGSIGIRSKEYRSGDRFRASVAR